MWNYILDTPNNRIIIFLNNSPRFTIEKSDFHYQTFLKHIRAKTLNYCEKVLEFDPQKFNEKLSDFVQEFVDVYKSEILKKF